MRALLPRERAATAAVLAAMALVVLDAGIVNVALPVLADALGAAPGRAILAVSAYQLALVMGLLPCAHLADRLGYRRLFVTGIALFAFASLLCAAAPTLPLLVAARFLQGLGGAAIMALGIALLRVALGAERLGSAIGWNALTVALCAAAGPTIGAVILSFASWPWLFLAGLPVAILAMLAARALPEVPPARQPLDATGIALYGAAAASLFAGAEGAGAQPLAAICLAAAALACIALLVRRGRRQAAPIIPFDLLARPPFRIAAIASICCFAGQSAGLVAHPFDRQAGHGPLAAGLVITCWPLAVAAASRLASRASGRIRAGAQCALGAGVLASGLLLSAILPADRTPAPLAIGALLCGAGFGLFQLANNRTLFLTAPVERGAAAGGLQGTARLTGQTLGTLMISLIFALAPIAIAPRLGLAAGAGFALAAGLVSLLGIEARNDPGPAARPGLN
jgi:DHA2 family multidrug resistance protein-like MFS transporter